jgi:hypothetical protein
MLRKKFFIAIGIVSVLFTACDKVNSPYPVLPSTELDYTLYPDGDSAHYYANYWPTWTVNTNTDRNVLIEDFTGHKCIYCPAAAVEAENIEAANPGRVFVSAVHASPNGLGAFQSTDATFIHDFTCPAALEIGQYFGNEWSGSPFTGNPFGSVSRYDSGNGFPVQSPTSWSNTANTLLTANDLKVNIQAATNFFPSTSGLFVHVEAEVLDQALTNELKLVVQLHEDSLVAPQKYPGGSSYPNDINDNYVHRDVLVGTIDGRTFGQTLDDGHLDGNGKYYFNYSYELPAQYDPSNMHLIIYVRDNVTEEIYHVIEKHFD